MADQFVNYLERELARLEEEIARELRRPQADQVQLARLKKLKLAVKDQIGRFDREPERMIAA